LKVKELIKELEKQDQGKEVMINDTIFIGCRKQKSETGESNLPFYDKINISIQTVCNGHDKCFIEINRYI
jgi:hypothetical protein